MRTCRPNTRRQVFRHETPHVVVSSEICKTLGRTFAPFSGQTRLVRKREAAGRRLRTLTGMPKRRSWPRALRQNPAEARADRDAYRSWRRGRLHGNSRIYGRRQDRGGGWGGRRRDWRAGFRRSGGSGATDRSATIRGYPGVKDGLVERPRFTQDSGSSHRDGRTLVSYTLFGRLSRPSGLHFLLESRQPDPEGPYGPANRETISR